MTGRRDNRAPDRTHLHTLLQRLFLFSERQSNFTSTPLATYNILLIDSALAVIQTDAHIHNIFINLFIYLFGGGWKEAAGGGGGGGEVTSAVKSRSNF